MIVVDASVLVDFLLGRPQAIDAVLTELAGREDEPLHAPELVEPEVLNALRRLAGSGSVSEERATDAVADLAETQARALPARAVPQRVWELRHELTAYDAAYLALAEALDDPALITGDAGLAARACMTLVERGVRHVP